ncbi:MAG: 4-hydroxy-tetrahydrodipicolinate reductase [Hyphomicrobium sp.]|uniref:4-hydroxy-tetrahydrodipicolinate reductase n=1 Tax=Hyphomicrobium sp. TaxID=82 RepID=UPI00132544A6|nr:4-hydroxy-tetrahydrodipicolinate reductase [Hyphomicrobium sp.]KAB2944086.1 MAG: 4-hydroxy-tetrahydrodipicolinate reductase [Hyphomicrobium sp.]MBZ0209380.1 4-hydroxy-tetrahydrodipicolinate reductase [Hyphomicrobium sp.]
MKVAVMGVAGRMGQELVRAAHAAGCSIVGGVEREGSPAIGSDVGVVAGLTPLGVSVTSDALDAISRCDGILDFTSPKATVEFAALAANARAVHVIGTTGLTPGDEAQIAAAARHAPIVKAGNMSLGVNLLMALTRRVAEALDEDFDIEIVEMHHRDKVDAPSGTALMLGAAAAEGRGLDLRQHSVRARDGVTGPRRRGDIGFASLRGGSVVGEHRVIFAGPGERVELAHVAGDRSVFARGAVKALLWGHGRAPGLYSMSDVLGL